MPENARTSSRGPRPRGRTGPGRSSASGRGTRAPAATGGAAAAAAAAPRRSRLTGRAAILVLVLAVLVVSYASSMRAYLQQRAHITDVKDQIALREANISDLEREKRRWEDPAYVKQQARALNYVMPGETSYVVLDADGQPLDSTTSLSDPADVEKSTPKAWWDTAWESVELAGNPPKPKAPPASEIDAPARQLGSDE